MNPTTVDGFQEAWATLQRLWAGTCPRPSVPARAPPRAVRGEWSFIETLRHLDFASAAWVSRMILGDPSRGTRSTCLDDAPGWDGIPWDREARPTLDEVLAVRQAAGDRPRCHHLADRRAARRECHAPSRVATARALPTVPSAC